MQHNMDICKFDILSAKGLHNLERKYARIFVLGHYPFLIAHSFLELCSQKTVRFSEQIMSADKYPPCSIFSHQMEAIVYIFPNFQNCAHCEKDLKDNKDNRLQLKRKYARIFVLEGGSEPPSQNFFKLCKKLHLIMLITM